MIDNVVVCPLHWYYNEARLDSVIEQMRTRGAPRLRGFYDAETNVILLREGTHRIRAAKTLGLIPVIVEIPWWRRGRDAMIRARFAAARDGILFRSVATEKMEESS